MCPSIQYQELCQRGVYRNQTVYILCIIKPLYSITRVGAKQILSLIVGYGRSSALLLALLIWEQQEFRAEARLSKVGA